ncbi:MAG: hypothetical protein WC943_05265 [Elusimicrobiota bacterium]|jgi:hypothetical protein
MTRPSALSLAVSLLFPIASAFAQQSPAPDDPLKALAASFQNHQQGQPFLDQAQAQARDMVCRSGAEACAGFDSTMLKSRDVQEGCAEPCSVELYRAKIGIVCGELGLEGRCDKAEANYIKAGVPRKKPTAAADPALAKFEAEAVMALLADPSIDPKLRTELNDRALTLAEALGSLQWMDADEGSAVAARQVFGGARAVVQPGVAGLKPLAKAAGVPIPAAQIEGRFRTMLIDQAGKYPTGSAVLKSAFPPPPVSFERIPDAKGSTTLAYYDNNKQKMVFNSERVAQFIQGLDPSAAGLDLGDVANLRTYLASHPATLDKMAGHFDVLYVHEMTHRAQHLKSGTNIFYNTVNGWKRILSGGKYPVEHEWEAFGNQNKYFAERGKKEPEVYDFRKSPEFGILEAEGYINDLQGYRRGIAALYSDSCDTADKLRFFKNEKPAYDRILAQEAKEWPRVSYEGNLGLARHWATFTWPDMSFGYLAKAYDRADKGGFLAQKKPEMAALFGETMKKLEGVLGEPKPGAPPRTVREGSKEPIRKLARDLGVTLPPKVAVAVRPAPTAATAPAKKP